MEFLRTPESNFEQLHQYAFAPHYLTVEDSDGNPMRMHYIDEGNQQGEVVLMLHGEPTWSYLYRNMITPLVDAGYRVIVPDLIGFGRSDKPVNRDDYTYQRHLDWLWCAIEKLALNDITLMCQDWGGLLGLRLVAENADRFARVCAANTFLPTGDQAPSEAFKKWQAYSQKSEQFDIGNILQGATVSTLSQDVIDAYNAPFPDERYKAGARAFPMLVPIQPNDPASEANRQAWQVLKNWHKPFITAFSDSDPVTAGGDKALQKLIPGCQGQAHTTIQQGGHFLQEDQPSALAEVLIHFIQRNPITERE